MDRHETEWKESSEPGVIERRSLLWAPILMAGPAMMNLRSLAASIGDADAATDRLLDVSREALGREWQALARALCAAPSSVDESYAAQLAGWIARVPIDALPRLERSGKGRGLEAGPTWRLAPCITVEFRMEPGAELKAHNHPPQVVVSLCAEGELEYRHFELEPDAPPCTELDGREFAVRETRSGILKPRSTTSLTRTRDGIHTFRAGASGARLIDFIVATTDDIETFSYVEIADAPTDRSRRTYRAQWLGKKL